MSALGTERREVGTVSSRASAFQLILISPEADRVDEHEILVRLFEAGLGRYHVRKPQASEQVLRAWIDRVPGVWRHRLVLHSHHRLAPIFGIRWLHFRDAAGADTGAMRTDVFTSRSCHELFALRAALGAYDSVFYGPVFPSISKPGYGPRDAHVGEALGALLHSRTPAERATGVIALGGITPETVERAAQLGFDGVATLGAVWQAPDPIAAFLELQACCAARGTPGPRTSGSKS